MPATNLPRLGLGTANNTDPEQCADSVATALDMGYRHVDTAQNYDNETHVGEGIARAATPREEVFLATKVDPGRLGGGDVRPSVEESLDRLDVDYVDLLYVHWPKGAYDPDETLPAFEELRDDGLIRHVGLSNFTPDLLDEARDVLSAPVAAHQVEMHPLFLQEELLDYARAHDHWLVAYSPLATGEAVDVPVVREVAEKHDATPAQVCLAWLLAKENVAAIPKATDPPHLEENYAAQDLELDDEDVARIDGIDERRRFVDRDDAPWNRT